MTAREEVLQYFGWEMCSNGDECSHDECYIPIQMADEIVKLREQLAAVARERDESDAAHKLMCQMYENRGEEFAKLRRHAELAERHIRQLEAISGKPVSYLLRRPDGSDYGIGYTDASADEWCKQSVGNIAQPVYAHQSAAGMTVTDAMVDAGITAGNAQYEHDARHTYMTAAERERSMYRAIITAALTAAHSQQTPSAAWVTVTEVIRKALDDIEAADTDMRGGREAHALGCLHSARMFLADALKHAASEVQP